MADRSPTDEFKRALGAATKAISGEKELGEKFNLRQFNEMILEDGAMPLGILDREVDSWIAEQKG